MAQSRALLISHSGSAALRYHFANYCASISKPKSITSRRAIVTDIERDLKGFQEPQARGASNTPGAQDSVGGRGIRKLPRRNWKHMVSSYAIAIRY